MRRIHLSQVKPLIEKETGIPAKDVTLKVTDKVSWSVDVPHDKNKEQYEKESARRWQLMKDFFASVQVIDFEESA